MPTVTDSLNRLNMRHSIACEAYLLTGREDFADLADAWRTLATLIESRLV